MIYVFSVAKKRKYYYLTAKSMEKDISATITLDSKVSVQIDNQSALYYLQEYMLLP